MTPNAAPNPAPDATHRVERFAPGAGTRVPEVAARAGGKDVDVARALRGPGTDPADTDPAVTGPAVAVGSAHAVLTRDAALDFGLIAALIAALVAALVDTRRYLGPAREATAAEVARLLAVLDAAR
ncbi:hypothetical protein [Kitasatospora fiedleri]|uniref:hypothetical protein n=1 Tax=Kitasatospora fiedleri TaxID=2991545 RepID=UPI002499BBE0|nr:hypothetical protein [Kitasatospora fiedleri]